MTDSDVFIPYGAVEVSWSRPAAEHGEVVSYIVKRSAHPGSSSTDPMVEIWRFDAVEYSGTENLPQWGFDFDVIPQLEYWWQVEALMDDGNVVSSDPFTEDMLSLDWLYGYTTTEGMELFWFRHPLEVSSVVVERTDLSKTQTPETLWTMGSDYVLTDIDNTGKAIHYYKYQVEYFDVPEDENDTAESMRESNEVTLRAGLLTPSEPLALSVSHIADDDEVVADVNTEPTVKLTWGSSSAYTSQIGYYVIERKDLNVGTWEDVGSTRTREWVDRTVDLSGGEYDYRVTPYTYDERKGDSSVERLRLTVHCDGALGNGRKSVIGYSIFVEQYLGHEADPDTYPYDLSASAWDVSFVGVNADGDFCVDLDPDAYTITRTEIYRHAADETSCGLDDSSPPLIQSCDLVGGSVNNTTPTGEVVTFTGSDFIESKEWIHWKPMTELVVSDEPETEKGIYRYEYQVCTNAVNSVCSWTANSSWTFVDIETAPFTVAQ